MAAHDRARRAARSLAARASVPRRRTSQPLTYALTFDDGPDPRYTPQVLDVLGDHGARATFFLVGARASRHPDLVRRIVAEGHGLGSHTWSHPELAGRPLPDLLRECHRGRRAVERAAGRPVPMYRPPKGHFEPRGALAARLLGLRPWLWSLDPSDWRSDLSAEDIVTALSPLGPGDVVLLHDGVEQPESPAALDRSATVAALEPLLELARRRRLHPVVLDGA